MFELNDNIFIDNSEVSETGSKYRRKKENGSQASKCCFLKKI